MTDHKATSVTPTSGPDLRCHSWQYLQYDNTGQLELDDIGHPKLGETECEFAKKLREADKKLYMKADTRPFYEDEKIAMFISYNCLGREDEQLATDRNGYVNVGFKFK